MEGSKADDLTEKLFIWAKGLRLQVDIAYNGTEMDPDMFMVRIRPWKQPATGKYMHFGSGKTIVDAARKAMQEVVNDVQHDLDWSVRTNGELRGVGTVAKSPGKPAF